VKLYWQRETKELGDKPVPVPSCARQNLHWLTMPRNRASAVRGQGLTAWAMARVFKYLKSLLLILFRYCWICCLSCWDSDLDSETINPFTGTQKGSGRWGALRLYLHKTSQNVKTHNCSCLRFSNPCSPGTGRLGASRHIFLYFILAKLKRCHFNMRSYRGISYAAVGYYKSEKLCR
jgi:hypothetical protein